MMEKNPVPVPVAPVPVAEITPRRVWLPLALVIISGLLGLLIGATTNLINGTASPYYFRSVLWTPWLDDEEVRRLAVEHGILEGMILGAIFGIIFSIGAIVTTGLRCPAWPVMRALLVAVAVVLICWIFGGVIGLAWASLSPTSYSAVIRIAPSDPAERLRFAWVGGTIQGVYVGTLIAAGYAIIVLRRWWRGLFESRGFSVLDRETEAKLLAALNTPVKRAEEIDWEAKLKRFE